MDKQAWDSLINGTACPMCVKKQTEFVLTNLPSGNVLLLDDGDFMGYLILEYRRHVTEITELTPEERVQLMEDINTCAGVLQSALNPDKINYVILGNETPHLHVHIIPRGFEDGWWGKPTWLRPSEMKKSLTQKEYLMLRETLKNAFTEG